MRKDWQRFVERVSEQSEVLATQCNGQGRQLAHPNLR